MITLITSKPCSYLDPSTLSNKRPKTLPMISEILCQRSSWTTLRPRKEPFTLAMIDALRQWLFQHLATHSLSKTFLISECAVYDWVRLGFFTGLRLSEYGQTSATASTPQRFGCIPFSCDAGPWARWRSGFHFLQLSLMPRR
jgi:hypothetical protein